MDLKKKKKQWYIINAQSPSIFNICGQEFYSLVAISYLFFSKTMV